MSKKVAVFVDVSNIYYCVGKKFHRKVNYQKYLDAAVGEQSLYRAYAYGAQINDEATKFLNCLRSFGYEIKYKQPKLFDNPEYRIDLVPIDDVLLKLLDSTIIPSDMLTAAREAMDQVRKILKAKRDTIKADWDVGIAIDIVRIATRVDTIVLGSADSDLAPLVEWVKDQGCRCEVFACNVSKELRDVADMVTEIDANLF